MRTWEIFRIICACLFSCQLARKYIHTPAAVCNAKRIRMNLNNNSRKKRQSAETSANDDSNIEKLIKEQFYVELNYHNKASFAASVQFSRETILHCLDFSAIFARGEKRTSKMKLKQKRSNHDHSEFSDRIFELENYLCERFGTRMDQQRQFNHGT